MEKKASQPEKGDRRQDKKGQDASALGLRPVKKTHLKTRQERPSHEGPGEKREGEADNVEDWGELEMSDIDMPLIRSEAQIDNTEGLGGAC
ncbi:hypothetical protein MGYG_02004 [Nannizzia gypsea CBS 118893]|uniref:Uncharacterized protein n=1 Tax=Arthroderma gypseum (strain ATCC MYA-4604 / CBS 118893) TaxID=535722 RepID=E4UP51_ARTGP|nr:hypothetical protein MGYG_02004 [Nannizzia gypsea CBS 118893]EFQ98993.1 hypothetical protein MGYG_02004 [Nannizzia gypsea CBS 118893]